jgi:hypothetical protein
VRHQIKATANLDDPLGLTERGFLPASKEKSMKSNVSVNESSDSLSKAAKDDLDKQKYWTSTELIQMATS